MTQRLVALYSEVSARKQRLGDLSEQELERVRDAQTELAGRKIILFDLSCSSLAEMRCELRAIAQREPIAAVIIDHCVMHVVNHVNREGAKGRPTRNDIRDGGNPEGHAHAVIMPYRPHPVGLPEEREIGEFIIAAAREGNADVVPMRFIGHRGLWLDENTREPWFEKSSMGVDVALSA